MAFNFGGTPVPVQPTGFGFGGNSTWGGGAGNTQNYKSDPRTWTHCTICDVSVDVAEQMRLGNCQCIFCKKCLEATILLAKQQKPNVQISLTPAKNTQIVVCPSCKRPQSYGASMFVLKPACVECSQIPLGISANVCTQCKATVCANCYDVHVADNERHEQGQIGHIVCKDHNLRQERWCNNCSKGLCASCTEHDAVCIFPDIKHESELTSQDIAKVLNREQIKNAIIEIEQQASTLDTIRQNVDAQIEKDYQDALNNIEKQKEEKLKIAKQKQEQNRERTLAQIEHIKTIIKYVERVKRSNATNGRAHEIVARVQEELAQLPLSPQLDTQTPIYSRMRPSPTILKTSSGLTIKWERSERNVQYRVRAIIRSISKQPTMLIETQTVFSPIYADSSLGRSGVIIYSGSETSCEFQTLQYGMEYQFTVEEYDSNKRTRISEPTQVFMLNVPKLGVQVQQEENCVIVRPTGLPEMDGECRLSCYDISRTYQDEQLATKTIDTRKLSNCMFTVTMPSVGRYIQFQVSSRNRYGETVPSPLSPPILCSQVSCIRNPHSVRYEPIDIFAYFTKTSSKMEITSSSAQEGHSVSIIGAGPETLNTFQFHRPEPRTFALLLEDSENWILFNFAPYAVSLYNITGLGYSRLTRVESSHDGKTWEVYYENTDRKSDELSFEPKFYTMFRLRGEEGAPLQLNDRTQFYGIVRAPFVFESKFGSKMKSAATKRIYTDVEIL